MGEIRAYLGDLKLEVKGNWQVFPVAARGIDFVGYVFFHTHTRMRKGIKRLLPAVGEAEQTEKAIIRKGL